MSPANPSGEVQEAKAQLPWQLPADQLLDFETASMPAYGLDNNLFGNGCLSSGTGTAEVPSKHSMWLPAYGLNAKNRAQDTSGILQRLPAMNFVPCISMTQNYGCTCGDTCACIGCVSHPQNPASTSFMESWSQFTTPPRGQCEPPLGVDQSFTARGVGNHDGLGRSGNRGRHEAAMGTAQISFQNGPGCGGHMGFPADGRQDGRLGGQARPDAAMSGGGLTSTFGFLSDPPIFPPRSGEFGHCHCRNRCMSDVS